jgi:hypothetical protein
LQRALGSLLLVRVIPPCEGSTDGELYVLTDLPGKEGED